MVTKYVNMIYANKPGGDHAVLTYDEFSEFVTNHPNLFRILYRCFNYDIWGIDK